VLSIPHQLEIDADAAHVDHHDTLVAAEGAEDEYRMIIQKNAALLEDS